MAADRSSGGSPTARTANIIAFALILIYGLGLLGIGSFSAFLAFRGIGTSETWFELLKSGFLILGGALSTVVGYYFGSRGIQEAEANARQAEERARAAVQELENERRERLRSLGPADLPTLDEQIGGIDGLIDPETYQEPEQN